MAMVASGAWGDGNGNDDGDYLVRAYFDNAGFVVTGEEVRIAGARVGSVQEVDVSRPGEAVTEDGSEDPGKAVIVLKIDDGGFQNFLTDASCLIRPQSLLGEKYVDCEPTMPRAPGSEPPPPLEQIPDGDIGAGQYRLPLENNGKQVDLDLINNITRQPESERFRLIINDLGAALAARGDELADVIRRANPALRETDAVLSQLADQNKQLAQLATDSDTILTPLARERAHISGFIRNATIAGEASAERRDDIVLGFQRFPEALNQLQLTMVQLRKFAEAGTPLMQDLETAAPGFTGATGNAAAVLEGGHGSAAPASAAPPRSRSRPGGLRRRDPRPPQARRRFGGNDKELHRVLKTFRKTNGIKYLMHFLLKHDERLQRVRQLRPLPAGSAARSPAASVRDRADDRLRRRLGQPERAGGAGRPRRRRPRCAATGCPVWRMATGTPTARSTKSTRSSPPMTPTATAKPDLSRPSDRPRFDRSRQEQDPATSSSG